MQYVEPSLKTPDTFAPAPPPRHTRLAYPCISVHLRAHQRASVRGAFQL